MLNSKIRQKHLEIILSKLERIPRPKLGLEAYTLDAKSAAILLNFAGYFYNDIIGKRILDLGCGNGILTIGAALIGGSSVLGVDIDKYSIQVAKVNALRTGVDVNYVICDINVIRGYFDTVLMNPPFGSWNRGSDVIFLKKALEISRIVYSLHKSGISNRRFLKKTIEDFKGEVDQIRKVTITIPRIFRFHKRVTYPVEVDLYRIKR